MKRSASLSLPGALRALKALVHDVNTRTVSVRMRVAVEPLQGEVVQERKDARFRCIVPI